LAGGWWFVLREKYCWLVAGGWFVLRGKYCWLVADKPNEQAALSAVENSVVSLLPDLPNDEEDKRTYPLAWHVR
jgi:hypothetical protein